MDKSIQGLQKVLLSVHRAACAFASIVQIFSLMNCYFSFWILNTYKATPFLPVFSFPRNEQNNFSSSAYQLPQIAQIYMQLQVSTFTKVLLYTKMMWLRFFALMIKQKLCGNLRHFQTHVKWAHPLVKCSLSQFGISVQLAQD